MHRNWLTWIALPLAVISNGCAMCQSPYDYCGPTFMGPKGPGGDPCFISERAGSILAPAPVAPLPKRIEPPVVNQPSQEGDGSGSGQAPAEMDSNGDADRAPELVPNPDAGARLPTTEGMRVSHSAPTYRR